MNCSIGDPHFLLWYGMCEYSYKCGSAKKLRNDVTMSTKAVQVRRVDRQAVADSSLASGLLAGRQGAGVGIMRQDG
jgi:hypothetical protein